MSTLAFGKDGAVARSASDLYRAVWRWHFYAGLLVLPFMITLAITGGLYLFKDELDGLIHADLKQVEIRQSTVAPSQMVAAALAAYPGTAVKFTDPPTPDASAEITINAQGGDRLAVYIDPYDGKVLGSLPDRGTVMWTIRYLHSLKYFGTYARYAIEITAGWSILLVATGIYLWWPRRQTGGVISVRGTPRRRVFWRDTHAVTGIFVGAVIVFLAITGMPWSGVWGGKVNEWANGNNFGYPAGVRVSVPMSGQHLDDVAKTSWSLEQAQVPLSSSHGATPDEHSDHGGGGHEGHDESTATTSNPPISPNVSPIGIDAAIAEFSRLGLHAGYAVNLPNSPTGVYSGSVYPDDLEEQRIIHLDQYSGQPLIDMSYADYGALGKSLEWSINVHMGQQYGLANQLVLLAACFAIILLAVSAGTMWWKRRPKGSLGVPPVPQDKTVFRGLFALLVLGGVIFPLVGVSLLVMLVLDWFYLRMKPPQVS